VYYADGPAGSAARPLLLVHTVNAAAAASEVRPLYDHYQATRPVYALDLPGYGLSDRSDRPYTVRLMVDAVLAVAAEVRRLHTAPAGTPPAVDLLGVSLGCEFVARAAQEQPGWFHTLALVSPTGFNRANPRPAPPGSSRGIGWLHAALARFGPKLFGWLTQPKVIRFFLEKTWGGKRIDEQVWSYAVATTKQPGAHHAPLRFLSAFLFSADIAEVYRSLRLPVWMSHGVRGDFVDYRFKKSFADAPNWSFTVFQTGALPYFEVEAEFCKEYDTFLGRGEAPPGP
jgi:pimeloyl-ACP methyl ester carboxylesterase